MIVSIIEGLAKGIVGPVASIFNKKIDADVEKYKVDGKVDVALIDADARIIANKTQLLRTAMRYQGVRIAQYGVIYPWVFLYWLPIVVDSGFRWLGYWDKPLVLALPDNLDYVSYAIIGYLFADNLLGKHKK